LIGTVIFKLYNT